MKTRTILSMVTILLGGAAGCTGAIDDPTGRGPGGPGSTPTTGGGLTTSGGTTGGGLTTSGGTTGGGLTTGGGTTTTGGTTTGGAGMPPDPLAAGVMPMRRLNTREYNNTVRDLLAIQTKPANDFPQDVEVNFIYHRAGQVATLDASHMEDAAEAIAAAANVTTLAPCAAGAVEDTCAKTFITSFGLKAYRRPLLADEITRLTALYTLGRTTLALDFVGGVRLLIEAILQAPEFVYRWELGPSAATMEGAVAHLGPYEMASRLSYFLWRSMPDQALFDAAAANKLATEADVEAQARRMVADAKGKETVSAFFGEWLGIDAASVAARPKDAMLYPQFNDALKAAMSAETEAFVGNVIFGGDAKLETILTAPYSFITAPVATVYGVTGVTGTAAVQKTLNPMQRAGLLTQSAFLTVTGASDGSNPVKRGKKVYERLMCGVLPPPPPNVPPPKPPTPGTTTRQRFAEHDMQACAIGCHSLMDPIGFAFEHYDGLGAYRTADSGQPVDSSTTVTLDGTPKKVADAIELATALSTSTEVRNCFIIQMGRFGLLRDDTPADQASFDAAAGTFVSGSYSVKELLVGLAKSRTFRYRSLAAGEVQP